ncbi:hypothetical protein NBO_25g0012, partial [Nosema bombycis CQ1]
MSVYLKKIKRIISNFNKEEQSELIKYYFESAKRLLLDDKLVSRSKIHLLKDLKEIQNENDLNDLENDLMSHKVLQTRALILDLITKDYSKDTECIYKPEKWIKEIVKDIEETFITNEGEGNEGGYGDKAGNEDKLIWHKEYQNNHNDYNIHLLTLYNSKLINEFKSIFISNEKYGTGGNQLLLNFEFYSEFRQKKIEFDFEGFLKEVEERIEKDFETKKYFCYSDIINEEIEKKLKRGEIQKTFMNYITNYEEELDLKIIPESSQEEQKRRKKSTFISCVDKFVLEDEEIIKDLNSISKDPSSNIRVLDGVLYVRNHRIVRGDKVILKGRNGDIIGSVSLIDEDDIVVKSKENKRIRIALDELRKHNYSINKYNKK